MPISVTIGDEYQLYEAQFPEIIELGIRELRARSEAGFPGIRSVLEQLASLPSPEEILALRPTAALQDRISTLLDKNSTEGLTLDEQREWAQYRDLEHIVRMAKARALTKLKSQPRP